MQILASVFFCLLLVQCEWKESVTSYLLSRDCMVACCGTDCFPQNQDENKPADCDNNNDGDFKQCCKSCFYFPSLKPGLAIYLEYRDLFKPDEIEKISGFQADCFHPPEITVI